MNKSTLFTAFLAGLMMVIMTELLVERFLSNSSQLKTDVLEVSPMSQQMKNDDLNANNSLQQTFTISLHNPVEKTFPSANQINQEIKSNLNDSSKITFPLLKKAGFEEVILQRIPYDGLLFGQLETKKFLTLPVIVQNLLKNNVSNLATFYEFGTKSKILADHVYTLLKENFSHLKNAGVNPTDEFLEHSFYVNFLEEPKNAFLVVKKGENVYALTYQKESHPFIKMLLPLLP